MAHAVFHTAQIMPINTQVTAKPKPLSSSLPVHKLLCPAQQLLLPTTGKHRRCVTVKASGSSSTVEDSVALLERCFVAEQASSMGPVMKDKFGSLGAVTLEKSKLDLTQKQSRTSPELFDRKFVDAVLNEWQKTMMDLPAGFRQAYEMGLVSSAQMVKFLAINARPTTTRMISRSLPQGLSRGFIGRMIADPAFLYKLLLEQAATIGCSVWWEVKNRKERIKQEWDLALVNVLTVTACNAIAVWSLAPCRSYGNTFRFDLQNTLQKLPNNVFEKSYPMREFDLQKRFHSFFFKAAELCMVGLTAGAVQGSLSNYLASKKEGRLSVTIPSARTNALGYGAFLGLYANLRYQLLSGFDKAVVSYFDVIGVGLVFSTALRIMNVQLGESSRLAWLGVEADPLANSDSLLKAYNRPSENVDQQPSSKWFISKNAMVSGLGLLGIKQSNTDSAADGDSSAPRAKRKRVVRKKVAASS
ncbi:hypothetical protein F8388_010588 [Cannabis sativa]|uniref:Protein RETICULATA-RELATED 1, chloroplastic n=1 Tax=Cannabis sativa TaxID=3483 RepID=A0A7J6GRL1_CANSA|nr:hypothetical protein G4B88_017873 [Cannabis sativa]KAF4384990.1 hypothetical protein F8388_010588 [Cannabis sativa]